MLYTIIQIIFAIILLIIMAIISYSFFNKDIQSILNKLTNPKQIKKKEKIIDGTFSFEGKMAKFNTTNKTKNNYKEISPSLNQKSGIEYSYNFWIFMNKNNTPDSNTEYSVPLFIKGSEKPIKYKSKWNCNDVNENNGVFEFNVKTDRREEDRKGFLVKNPLVKVNFKNDRIDAIVFEFNSISSPDIVHEDPEIRDCSAITKDQIDKNLFGIYNLNKKEELYKDNSDDSVPGKWSMITLVIKETDINNNILFRNKAKIKLYLNGHEYFERSSDISNEISTAFRNNISNFYINPLQYTNPSNGKRKITIADLTYFNYALSDNEIINLYNTDINLNQALIPNENDTEVPNMNKKSGLEITRDNNISIY
jgi:hypothetical protein